jgi:hypothetical protein
MKLLNKLTTKTVCGDLRKVAAQYEDGEDVIVMTVYGHANDKKAGTHTMSNGEETRFVKFYGKSAAWPGLKGEGEECRAGNIVLPDIPTALLDAQVRGYEELTKVENWEEKEARKFIAEQDVQYGFQIGITVDAKAITGYRYFAAPLMRPENKDSLDELGDLLEDNAADLMAKRKRLPAPDAASKKKAKRKTKRKAKAQS